MVAEIGFTLACLLWSFIAAEIESLYDARKIGRDRTIVYWSSAVMRGGVLGSSLFALAYLAGVGWLSAAAGLSCSLAFFWLIFDLRLNQRRELPHYYLGERSWLDRLLSLLPTWARLALKVTLLLTSITLIFVWSEAA